MARKQIRFAVTNGSGLRAATWKLWTQDSAHGQEFYLTCRELGGAIHTSFHPSGQWHTTHTWKAIASAVPPIPQRIEQWPRPIQTKPGVTLAYKILTPWSSVVSPVGESMKSIVAIPQPPKGFANEIMILMIEKGVQLQIQNAVLIGQLHLLNGGLLAIVNHEIRMPEIDIPTNRRPNFYPGKSKDDLIAADNLRMMLFADDQNANRMIVDCSVRVSNGENEQNV